MPASLKVNCDRTALVDALALASAVVPSRTTTPVLTCLKLVGKDGELQLRATDGQISLALTVPGVEVASEGEALVPADKLGQIVRTCEDSTVALETDRNVATVRGDGSTFKIYGYDPKDYPAARETQPDLLLGHRRIEQRRARTGARRVVVGVEFVHQGSDARVRHHRRERLGPPRRRLADLGRGVARGHGEGKGRDGQAEPSESAMTSIHAVLRST